MDRNLCALLAAEFGDRPAFRAGRGAIWPSWTGRPLLDQAGGRPVIAGNLPYVLTSKVLFALADLRERVAGGVFMVQKEVAERLVAPPGGRDYGVLAVVLGVGVRHRRSCARCRPRCSGPGPRWPRRWCGWCRGPTWTTDEYAGFPETVKTLFGQRRKKLGTHPAQPSSDWTTRRSTPWRTAAGLDVDARPEQIDVAGLSAAWPPRYRGRDRMSRPAT